MNKTKCKNITLAILVTIITIGIPSLLLNKWYEGIFLFVCHWIIREQFPKQYHHIIPAICRTLTSIILFFGTLVTLPLDFSLISAIPICYFISWVGYVKKDRDDLEFMTYRQNEEIDQLKVMLEKITKDLNVYKTLIKSF